MDFKFLGLIALVLVIITGGAILPLLPFAVLLGPGTGLHWAAFAAAASAGRTTPCVETIPSLDMGRFRYPGVGRFR